MELKARSIELCGYQEDLQPSARKLFHCIFKDKFGPSYYRWTPPWKGEYGVESLLFKALKVEEWNDGEGVWSQELRKVSEEIPSLDEMRLPISIVLGPVKEGYAPDGQEAYYAAIDLLRAEEGMWLADKGAVLCVGPLRIYWSSFRSFLAGYEKLLWISDTAEEIEEYLEFGPERRVSAGVRFWVAVETQADNKEYEVVGKEIAFRVRSFIRQRLSAYKGLKRGLEQFS